MLRFQAPVVVSKPDVWTRRGKETENRNKGLGEGGAKRHRKVLCDNIQGITKPAIRRLARRGGVQCIRGLIYEEGDSEDEEFPDKPVKERL